MKRLSTTTKHCGLTTTIAAAAGSFFAGAATIATGAQGVVITGLQIEYADEINPDGHLDSQITIEDICSNSTAIAWAVNGALDATEQAIAESGWAVPMATVQNVPDMPTRADIARDVENVRAAVCDAPEPETTAEVFTITYSSCRMGMITPTNAMVINMPEDGTSAFMLAADHTTRDVMHIELTSHITGASEVVGQGWSDQINITSLGETAEISGYDTTHYEFDYRSGLGETSQGELGEADIQAGQVNDPTRLGNLIAVQSDGTAWISDDAPGIDIVRSFYQNLTSRFQPDSGANSFFGGIISNLVGMLEKGIPIVIEQTTSSSVMGRTMVRGKSESHVSNIRLRDLPPDYCSSELESPAGYQVTNVNEQMDASSAEMAQAMQEYNAAMQQMTPEQRQMMEQLGLGGMMGQTGGTSPAVATQGAATGTSAAGSNRPSSANLTTDNPTQTVQQHLAALGYDTGNTNGDMSLETTIAISQFQAEKGMAVTGEVSPQLIGALAAEVDRGQ